MISRTFKLCLNAGSGSAPYINVNQYDEGETWLFELYSENGERYIPSSGAIVGVKSDGHGIANTGTVDSEGRVVITETQQMTASAGRAIYELSIDGLTHGTANFIVAVERKPTDEAVMSDSDLSLIQEAVDSAAVIVEVIGDSDPSEVIGEHVDEWLDNHPEATTTVQDGAITAPKINSTLWDKLLVNEEASGNPASFEDGADDVPVSSLKVALEPIQLGSGDPSPTNVRPIYPANGKNILNIPDMDTTFGALTVKSNNGVCIANGTATSGTTCTLLRMTGTLPAGEYILNGNANFTQQIVLQVYSYTRSSNIARCLSNADVTFTVNANEDIVVVLYVFSGQTLNNFTFYPMIRLAEITDSTYQPYQGIMVDVKGINQWDEEYQFGYYDANGIFHARTTQGEIASKNMIRVAPNTTYYFHIGSPVNRYVSYYDANGIIISQSGLGGSDTAFTTPNNCHFINFNAGANYGTTYNNDISINYPSTITDYHAYNGTSYPYSLGQNVYGGSVDLATGVLTVTWGTVDMGNLNWSASSTTHCFYAAFGTYPQYKIGSDVQFVCTQYKYDGTRNASPYYGDNGTLRAYGRANATSPSEIYARDDRYTAVADFKTAVTGQTICYEIDTPQTIQLTPQEVKTLLGYNSISSTGTVDVIYHADTKLYVDKMTNVDNNIIAPTEADFVATRNYTVNDLVIVADTLYKATANIASGSTITPNSNVTQTTLSALIKALS